MKLDQIILITIHVKLLAYFRRLRIFLPFVSQTSELAGKTCGVNRETNITKHSYTGKEGNSSEAGSLFCDAVGAGISDFKKERLKVLLRQSAVLLSQEVDEMVDPVFAMRRIQRYKMKISNCPSATCEDNGEHPHKKHKLSSSSSSIRSSPISNHNGEGSGNENMYLAKPGEAKSNVVNKICSNCLTNETSRWSSDSEVLKSLCHDCEIKSKGGKESLAIKDQKTKSGLTSNIGVEKEDGEVRSFYFYFSLDISRYFLNSEVNRVGGSPLS